RLDRSGGLLRADSYAASHAPRPRLAARAGRFARAWGLRASAPLRHCQHRLHPRGRANLVRRSAAHPRGWHRVESQPDLPCRRPGGAREMIDTLAPGWHPIVVSTKPVRVVILGGGFAGVYAARYLERLSTRGAPLDVTLVSQDNFFLFTPMLHEVAASD